MKKPYIQIENEIPLLEKCIEIIKDENMVKQLISKENLKIIKTFPQLIKELLEKEEIKELFAKYEIIKDYKDYIILITTFFILSKTDDITLQEISKTNIENIINIVKQEIDIKHKDNLKTDKQLNNYTKLVNTILKSLTLIRAFLEELQEIKFRTFFIEILENIKEKAINKTTLKNTLNDTIGLILLMFKLKTKINNAHTEQFNSTDFIRINMHTELQKFGKKQTSEYNLNMIVKNNPELQQLIKEYHIYSIGIDNTIAQNTSLFAIQILLNKTNYKGNMEGNFVEVDDDDKIYVPKIKFSVSEYLEAYGLQKRITSRNKNEFLSNERKEALKALYELANKQCLIFYRRQYWIKNSKGKLEHRNKVIKTIRPLINIIQIYDNLTNKESDELLLEKEDFDEKLRYIILEPCPILVDQIDTHFIIKPANYRQEIKQLKGKVGNYVYLFIDYIISQAEFKRRNKEPLLIKISYKNLIHKLRMDTYINNRMHKKINNCLSECFNIAKELKYILDIKQDENNIFEINFNPDKLYLAHLEDNQQK